MKWSLGRLSWVLVAATIVAPGEVQSQLPSRNVNMVAGTSWPGGDPFLQRQNEPACAVSTRNRFHLVCGANDYRTVDLPGLAEGKVTGDAWLGVFKSFDAGNRWQSTLLPGYPQGTDPRDLTSPLHGYEAGADPVVRAAHNGLFYYSGIVFDRGEGLPSATFVARFIDLNNKEGVHFDIESESDPIKYIDAEIVDRGNIDKFVDKPWLAVDIPRAGAETCSLEVGGETQTFPGGRVFLSYTVLQGEDPERPVTKVMLSRSTDCGETWIRPQKLSAGSHVNQGSTIGIDPRNGDVYVAWRRFGVQSAPDAIVIARSINGGQSFTRATEVATLDAGAFEQGTTAISFRTTMFPSMTVDNEGRVYIAWSERVGPEGDGRIVLASSELSGGPEGGGRAAGLSWLEPQAIYSPDERGHQFMPSLLFHQGQLAILYYDQQLDHTRGLLVCPGPGECTYDQRIEEREPMGHLAGDDGVPEVFNDCIAEFGFFDPSCSVGEGGEALERRHTVDVYMALADPGGQPSFDPPFRVSQYLFGSRDPELEGDNPPIEQFGFNPPNLPLFLGGDAPFFSDYLDLAGAPPFVPTPGGGWAFNHAPSGATVRHAVWTDNRDVRPPPDGDWSNYTPPFSDARQETSIFDGTSPVPECVADRVGMRNQNIYTSRITDGLIVGALQNSKPLGTIDHPEFGVVAIQRAFVIVAQNTADEIRHFRVWLSEVDPGAEASFEQFESLTTIDVSIAPRSTISRTVFMTSPGDPDASATISVARIEGIGGPFHSSGPEDSVVLNADPTVPALTNPDVGDPSDILQGEIYNPDIGNPDIGNPDIGNPDIGNPDIGNPDIGNPDIGNPDIGNPDIGNPDIGNPDIGNPDIGNPDIGNSDLVAGDMVDVTWTIENEGNTSASYDINLLLAGSLPEGFKSQLILRKVYLVPGSVNPDTCELSLIAKNVLVTNIIHPVFTSDPEELGEIDPANPDIGNATMSLAPGEVGKITLRVVDPDKNDETSIEDFLEETPLVPAVVPQSVDTEAVLEGETEPPSESPLAIATGSLPDGVVGGPYSEFLLALGGMGPLTWSISGSLPPGLFLNAATGEISGTPIATGITGFTTEVTDGFTSDTQPLEITIQAAAPPIVESVSPSIVHTPPEVGDLYSGTFVLTGANFIGGQVFTDGWILLVDPSRVSPDGQTIEQDFEIWCCEPRDLFAGAPFNLWVDTPIGVDTTQVTMALGPHAVITDPVGDALPSGGISPDLVSARVTRFLDEVLVDVRLAAGTFDPAANSFQIQLDTDDNPNTGHPGTGINVGGDDVAIFGGDYILDFGADFGTNVRIRKYIGPSPTIWLGFTTGITLPLATVEVDGMSARIPVSLLGGDEGDLNFKAMSILLRNPPNRFPHSGFLDYVTDPGQPPGATHGSPPSPPSVTDPHRFDLTIGSFGSGPGQFDSPHAVAADSLGDVYVVDHMNHRIQKFDWKGGFVSEWGDLGSGPGEFNMPAEVATDWSCVYVTDLGNHRVQVFDLDGNFISAIGSFGTGPLQFASPHGLAVSPTTGNLYVTERDNHRVQEVAAGSCSGGADVYVNDWGSLGSGPGEFAIPNGVAVDRYGDVYVSDENARVQKFDPSGTFLLQWGGPGVLSFPWGVSASPFEDLVYVADAADDRIQKFDLDGTYLSEWGIGGVGEGEFSAPRGLSADWWGRVWVADENNNRIQKFTPVQEDGRLYATDFDDFSLGLVEGQDGWSTNPIPGSLDGTIVDDGTGNQVLQVLAQPGWGNEVVRGFNRVAGKRYVLASMSFQTKDGGSPFWFMDNSNSAPRGPESLFWWPDTVSTNANPGGAFGDLVNDSWHDVALEVDQSGPGIVGFRFDGSWIPVDDSAGLAEVVPLDLFYFRGLGGGERLWIDNLSISESDVKFGPSLFNAGADFDASLDPAPFGSNPNGVWMYGETSGLSGALTVFPDLDLAPGLNCGVQNFWLDLGTEVGHTPSVSRTFGPCNDGNVTFDANQLILHGGPPDRYAHVRFTAPQSLTCTLDATFISRQNGLGADAHVLVNGVAVFSDTVPSAPGLDVSWTQPVSLLAGDTVSFAVGLGAPPQGLHPGNVELRAILMCY